MTTAKPTTNTKQTTIDPNDTITTLVSVTEASGKPAWAVMKMTLIEYMAYEHSIVENGRFEGDLTKHGEILMSGWGELPDEEATKTIMLRYGDKEVSEHLANLLEQETA